MTEQALDLASRFSPRELAGTEEQKLSDRERVEALLADLCTAVDTDHADDNYRQLWRYSSLGQLGYVLSLHFDGRISDHDDNGQTPVQQLAGAMADDLLTLLLTCLRRGPLYVQMEAVLDAWLSVDDPAERASRVAVVKGLINEKG